jgi:carbamoyltransferase
MIICGLKLTHDGAVAVIDGDELVFSVEMEKLDNRPRHSQVDELDTVVSILRDFGLRAEDVDAWVIDGWDGDKLGQVELRAGGKPLHLDLAPYRETEAVPDIFAPGFRGTFPLAGRNLPYRSFVHIAGHVSSAYCASPFGQRGEPGLVLVWDGGLFPRLYQVDPATGVRNLGELFPLTGHTYATAAHHFGPFHWDRPPSSVNEDLSVAGKLMAYIALGTPRPEVERLLRELFVERFDGGTDRAIAYRAEVGGFGSTSEPVLSHLHDYFREVKARLVAQGVGPESDADVLASVHAFLERLLVERLDRAVRERLGEGPFHLCFVGGCALNIKWNSTLRDMDLFSDVWVPPFPNDSGSAIGAALLGRRRAAAPLRWHVRMGPALKKADDLPANWRATPVSAAGSGACCTPPANPAWCSTAGRSWARVRSVGAASSPRPGRPP